MSAPLDGSVIVMVSCLDVDCVSQGGDPWDGSPALAALATPGIVMMTSAAKALRAPNPRPIMRLRFRSTVVGDAISAPSFLSGGCGPQSRNSLYGTHGRLFFA